MYAIRSYYAFELVKHNYFGAVKYIPAAIKAYKIFGIHAESIGLKTPLKAKTVAKRINRI